MNKDNLIELYYGEAKTLEEIGNLYGVTRERIRQIMEKFGLPRNTKRGGHPIPKWQDLDDYFEYIKNGGQENPSTLLKYAKNLKQLCQKCGSKKNLHIHHVNYPAECLDDIQILCSSCHLTYHKNGNNYKTQLQICDEYRKGKDGKELAEKYGVHFSLIYYFLHKWSIKTRPIFGRILLSPEERKNYASNYYQKNRDRLLIYKEEWYQQNKEEIKAKRRQRYWNKKLALVN